MRVSLPLLCLRRPYRVRKPDAQLRERQHLDPTASPIPILISIHPPSAASLPPTPSRTALYGGDMSQMRSEPTSPARRGCCNHQDYRDEGWIQCDDAWGGETRPRATSYGAGRRTISMPDF
ncbi:hypothetical protein MSAN_01086600 [Mycena sanguinolenta]|uniref:Uncharacterized protein n=1 Tax=Mycena sanguinolenta TaxID=230812 RepID=A0A8H6YQC2_9AGAR|nr:hypothetical protein MSAN_01086600 [Mycena sanguinolenta]